MSLTPKERAERAAATMWVNDQASQWFGMDLVDVDEGRATLTMKVEPQHCNGHSTCHGGVSFALADSTFAFACNSRNKSSVAQHVMMSYLAPARAGDRLTARAEEIALNGRSGIYDVRITNQEGQVIAEMRGFSRMINGQHFEE